MENKINQLETNEKGPRKRLLFIITQSEFGGAQRFLAQLIAHLELEHFEIAIVSGPDGNEEIKGILPEGVRYISAKHLRRNPNIFNDIASVFELKKIIAKFQPDALFLNSSKAGFIGSLAARLLQTKNYHDFVSQNRGSSIGKTDRDKLKTIYRIGGWAFNDPRFWWKRLGIRWLEKLSAPWKDYIVVNNKHDYDQAIKFNIKPKKEVVLIYNGIDPYKLDFLDKDEAKIRLYETLPSSQKHANFLHEGLTIGTIANFYPTKGLQYLIEALKILTCTLKPVPCTLVLIGDGPEHKNLQLLITNYKLQNTIFLAGRIPDAYKYLKALDVFVLPSVKEGFPWALLEAMSAKLPVIATTVGANPEIIENEKNGLLVKPADPQALVEALVRLADNEPLRRELGIQAHQTVLHKFDLRKMVSQIKTLL